MELTTKITLDMLTQDSVSVLKQQFLNYGGVEMQVGGNTRNTYENSRRARKLIKSILPSEYYNAVIAVWGDTPTAEEITK